MPGTVCLISVKQDSDAADVEEESSDTPAAVATAAKVSTVYARYCVSYQCKTGL